LSAQEAIATLASSALAGERAKAGEDHSVPGVKAVFAMAPVVQPLTPASLRAMREPVVIMAGGADETVPPATHALVARALIPGATVTILPGVTHYNFLATCSAAAVQTLPVCRDATAQERASGCDPGSDRPVRSGAAVNGPVAESDPAGLFRRSIDWAVDS
jgi:predicted dienelactone hydrolase